jgi:PKD repeat protein
MYQLDGSRRWIDGEERLQLHLDVGPAVVPTADASASADIVRAEPNEDDAVGGHVLTLTPLPWVQGRISASIGESEIDDVVDTLFASEHNALQLWFSQPLPHVITVSTQNSDGTYLSQSIFGSVTEEKDMQATIDSAGDLSGNIQFNVPLPTGVSPESVVYEWDFGDGTTSYRDAPLHAYQAAGDYSVQVRVRELSTGRIVSESKSMVKVTEPARQQPVQSSSARPLQASSSSANATGNISRTSVLQILVRTFQIIAILVGTILLGIIGVWMGRRFLHRESRLQKTLEDAEAALITGTDARNHVPENDTAPHLSIRPKEVPSTVTVDAPFQEESVLPTQVVNKPRDATPPANDAAAPAWLQHGLEIAEQQTHDAQPTGASPVLAGPIEDSPLTPVQTETEELPPWLRDDAVAVTEATQTSDVSPTQEFVAPQNGLTADATASPGVESIVPAPMEIQEPSEVTSVPEATIVPPLETASTSISVVPLSIETAAHAAADPASVPLPSAGELTTPTAIEEPIVLEPPVTPVQPTRQTADASVVTTDAPATPSPAPMPQTPVNAPPDDAAAEAERERKRRKRQRYRENLRKRQMAGNTTPQTPYVATVYTPTERTPRPEHPAPAAAPIAVATLTPPTAPVTASSSGSPVPLPQSTEAAVAESHPEPKPEPAPSAEAISPTDIITTPAPPSTPTVTMANPDVMPKPTSSDEDIAFVIRADSVSGDNQAST